VILVRNTKYGNVFFVGNFGLIQGNYIRSKGSQIEHNIHNDKRRTIEENQIFDLVKERMKTIVEMKDNTKVSVATTKEGPILMRTPRIVFL